MSFTISTGKIGQISLIYETLVLTSFQLYNPISRVPKTYQWWIRNLGMGESSEWIKTIFND